MRLDAAQTDRACGVLLGAACGDALGAGYEFGSAVLPEDGTAPAMIGGGLGSFAVGEWTDDTALTIAVAKVAATGADLRAVRSLDAIAQQFVQWWADGPADVGIVTGRVLAGTGRASDAATMRSAAASQHARTGRTAGNGSLMRTSAVALAHLGDPAAIVEAARQVSALTHADPIAGQACALWSLMINGAVLSGTLDAPAAVEQLPRGIRRYWADRLREAEEELPTSFRPNGYVVTALQAAWSAITHTPVPVLGPAAFPCNQLETALAAAVRVGDDTDTVAAIAGALLGARWGSSAIPTAWVELVHGWPGTDARGLVELALLTVGGGHPDSSGWPGCASIDYTSWPGNETLATHPHDPGVYLAGASALARVPDDVTAVVSLCRLGDEQVPGGLRHVDYRLLDTTAEDNPNLEYVIDEAARAVARFRNEGEVVLLHCVAAQSRTPTVAARYAALRGVPHGKALQDVVRALPHAAPNPVLVAALERLAG